ncbi:hypothetical protein [Leptolyngbya sp. KIOST-1]|uniref:hypothetical protein n=1 Tax=Leptolyngbya sp. KIOST-1 TaxID=1229172 RepID=UPI00056B0C36|nr:hypothetical protein [Leptolyngbya sp. KIOST-1]
MQLELGLIEPDQQRLWVYGLVKGPRPIALDTASPIGRPDDRGMTWASSCMGEVIPGHWDLVGQLLARS